jgi:hypothetical protein
MELQKFLSKLPDYAQKEFSDDGYISLRGLGRLCGIRHGAWKRKDWVFNKKIDEMLLQNNLNISTVISDKGIYFDVALVVISYYAYKSSNNSTLKAKKLMAELNGLEVFSVSPKPPSHKGFIYLIQNANTGNVKIGYSANPCNRLATHQISTDCELRLLAHRKGSQPEERQLHKKFADYLVRGEWFCPATEIMLYFGIAQDTETLQAKRAVAQLKTIQDSLCFCRQTSYLTEKGIDNILQSLDVAINLLAK